MRSIVVLRACTIGSLMNLHASADARCCAVIELRQYTLKPGQRDVLIDIFDRHFVEWSEFDARSDVEPVLNGLGNIDRYSAVRTGESIEGVTLRLFNPATGEWSIHWADTVRRGITTFTRP
jgi:hypothetical protein